jgi:phosphoenolpyruvate carboxykinase (ATP)
MRAMLHLRPTPEQLSTFGQPDFVIYNAGACRANNSSGTSVDISLKHQELVILGESCNSR